MILAYVPSRPCRQYMYSFHSMLTFLPRSLSLAPCISLSFRFADLSSPNRMWCFATPLPRLPVEKWVRLFKSKRDEIFSSGKFAFLKLNTIIRRHSLQLFYAIVLDACNPTASACGHSVPFVHTWQAQCLWPNSVCFIPSWHPVQTDLR
jgi:hypothetical protein